MVSRMKALCSMLVTVLACVGSAPADPLVSDATLQAAGFTRHWNAQLPIGPQDAIREGHLIDEALYIITEGGTLFALKADVGLIRWAEKLTAEDFTIYKPAHLRRADGAGPVVILTTGLVFVFDRFNGDLMQTFKPEFNLGSPPVGFGDIVFMGSLNGRVYSLLLTNPHGTRPLERWEVSAGGAVTAAPVLYSHDKLLFASHGGRLYSCYAWDKTFDWRFTTGGPILGSPAVDESGVYVASTDRSLYKVNADTGTMIWRRRFPCQLIEGPVVAAHTVYQYCRSDGLSAIDTDSSEQRWHVPTGRAFVAHTRGRDVVFTRDRRVLVVDRDSGEVLHGIDADSVIATVTNVRDDAVYLLGRDGRVLCAKPVSVPYLRSQEVTAARQRLNLRPIGVAETARRAFIDASEGAEPVGDDPLRSRHDGQP